MSSPPHTYSSSYPLSLQILPGIKEFFEEFYATTDNPDSHEKYVDSFTTDATLIMGIRRAVGSNEILQFRKGAWEKVAARKHTIERVYPFGDKSQELMLYGVVDFRLKDGKKADVEWAARAHLVKEGEKWKMGFYQVYLDSAAVSQAK